MRIFLLTGIICLTHGCAEQAPAEKESGEKDPVKAKALLIGKWEGEWMNRVGGVEFKASGEVTTIVRMFDENGVGGAPEIKRVGKFRLSGKPVGHPNAHNLIEEYTRPDGEESGTSCIEVKKDKISFFKGKGALGSYQRVQAFSSRLTGQ